jgi:hypothetical protein
MRRYLFIPESAGLSFMLFLWGLLGIAPEKLDERTHAYDIIAQGEDNRSVDVRNMDTGAITRNLFTGCDTTRLAPIGSQRALVETTFRERGRVFQKVDATVLCSESGKD